MNALHAHAAHFDALYEASDDPWDYARSRAEALKRRAIGQALGPGRGGTGLELGCGPGISTLDLSPRFARLVAVDGSARAVGIARERTRRARHVTVLDRQLPDGCPEGPFDAIIASEVLYYLPRPALTTTLAKVRSALAPGGRLVTANSTTPFSDRETSDAELTERLMRAFGPPRSQRVGAGWRLLRFGGHRR